MTICCRPFGEWVTAFLTKFEGDWRPRQLPTALTEPIG